MTEFYKIVNGAAPSIMNSFSELGNNEYNIGIFQVFSTDLNLKNGNVTHVPLIRNMVSKNVNLVCFTTIFLKNLEMSSPTKKNTK